MDRTNDTYMLKILRPTLFLSLAALLLASCITVPASPQPAPSPLFPALGAPGVQVYPPPQVTPIGPYPPPETPAGTPTAIQPTLPAATATAAAIRTNAAIAATAVFARTATAAAARTQTAAASAGVTLALTPGLTETPAFTLTQSITITPALPFVEPPPRAPSTPPPNLTRTLRLWHAWDSTQIRTLEHILIAFQQMQPEVHFDVLYVPPDELLAKFETEVARGGGPDILLAPAKWSSELAAGQYIANLSSYASAEFLATLNTAGLGECAALPELRCLPYALNGVLLYRNQQIVTAAPATFDELITAARAATRGGIVGADLEQGTYFAVAHLYGLGGRLWLADGSPAFNSPEGLAWLNLILSFPQAGPVEFNSNRDTELFMQGKAGIIIDGSWNLNALAQAVGEENLAIDPWPALGEGHLSGFVQADALYLNINLSGAEQLDALRFMGFFLTPEAQAVLADAGFIPAINDAPVRSALIRQAISAFANGITHPSAPQAQVYFDTLETALRDAIAARSSAESALQWAYDTLVILLAQPDSP